MSASLNVEGSLVDELPIDPFGAMPNWASRLSGLGGSEPPANPGYVFRTVPIRPGLGSVVFSLHFFGLNATCGTLRVEVNAVSAFPGTEPSALDALLIPLPQLADENGRVEVRVICRRNTLYGLTAEIIDDSDVTCSTIAIVADRRASSSERGQRRPPQFELAPVPPEQHSELFIRSWMTRLDAPSLEVPTSQGWTPEQARSGRFAHLTGELGLAGQPAVEAWGEVFILRALEFFSILQPGVSGAGFASEPRALSSTLAARRADTLLVEHHTDPSQAGDPGLALERHFRPAQCEEEQFYEHVFLTTGNWWNLPATLNDQFDFLWSIDTNRELETSQFSHFILSTIACLKPGGMAVHIFDLSESGTPAPSDAIGRPHLERLVAHALSHLNDVALLRFRGSKNQSAGSRPFGLVMRRGKPR